MALLTKVVIFGSDISGEDSGIRAVWDDAANVDEAGAQISQYYPGDSRYLLVFVPDKFRLVAVKSTSGTMQDNGLVARSQVDRVLFDEAGKLLDLSELPVGGVSPAWYGKSAVLTVEKQQVKASAAPAIADLRYSYAARQYQLTCPAGVAIGPNDDDDWPIGVVVYAEVTKQ